MSWTSKQYTRINWQNRPSTATALGATNLNKMDVFLNLVDNELITISDGKLDLSTANTMLKSVSYNSTTGVWTFTKLNGTTQKFDQNIEKIPVSFTLSDTGVLTMTNTDGTSYTCDVSELIKDYTYTDSDTVAFTKEFDSTADDGKGEYTVTAAVKEGSIQSRHLDPDWLSSIKTYTNTAVTAASDSLTYSKDSKRWAVGDDSYEGSDVDNAKYYKEQAEAAQSKCETIYEDVIGAGGTTVATVDQVGIVKPDGTTISITDDGTISVSSMNFKIINNQLYTDLGA